MKKIENSIFLKVCFLLLGFISIPTIVASFLFIFKISINFFTLPLAIVILLISYYKLFYHRENKKSFYIPIIVSLFLIISLVLLSILLYEKTYDGWAYHTPSVIHLKNGWNPLFNHNEDYGTWSVHYPKFIWIYGGILYKATGNMFAGTSFNFILALAIFFLTIDIFKKKKFSNFVSVLIGTVVAFNPVTIGQLFSYYNDGVLGLCIWGLLLIFYACAKGIYTIKNNYIILLIFSFFASILANVKFTGALFAFIIILVATIYFIVKKHLKFNKFMISYIMTIGLAVLIVGANTYLPNIIYHKNIGYPIVGENKIDIITHFVPWMFSEDGKLEAFVKSFLCDRELDHFTYDFNISYKDIYKTVGYDIRKSGFGPFYKIIVVISALAVMIGLIKYLIGVLKKKNKIKLSEYSAEFIIMCLVMICFYITPATWWFRYVPYMYIFPLIIMIFFDYFLKNYKFYKYLFSITLLIYVFSFVIYGGLMFHNQIVFSTELTDEIEHLKYESKQGDLKISVYDAKNFYYKRKTRIEILKNNGIEYEEYDEGTCKSIKNLPILGISTVECEE